MAENSPKPWVDGLTMGAVLAETARRHAQVEAMVFPQLGRRWTWQQFAGDVDAAARGLLALGIRRGEHVAVWATNVPQWVLLQFAAARIGAVLVNINPAYRPFELEYVLNQSDAVALFLVDEFKTSNYFTMLAEVCPDIGQARGGHVQSPKFPRLRNVVAMKGNAPAGLLTWEQMVAAGSQVPAARLDEIAAGLNCLDPINIQYTSGTTGFPKAATLSHRNLLLNAYHVGECQSFTAADRLCIPVPFYHCFGCVLGTLACAVHGTTMIVPAEYFQPRPTLDALEHERATAVYGVPTMYIAQLQDPTLPGRKFALRTGIMSGAPCPIEVMRQVIDKLGPREITIAYGQTEASPVITQTRTDEPLRAPRRNGRPPAAGRGSEDRRSGDRPGAARQPARRTLRTRGHVVMLGYYKNPDATAAAIDADGWLHTGDLAVRLPSGLLQNHRPPQGHGHPRRREHLSPRDRRVPVHAPRRRASRRRRPARSPNTAKNCAPGSSSKTAHSATEDQIRAFCREKLAHFKVPRYVKFVDRLPADGDRENPEIQDSRFDEGRTGAGGPEDGMKDLRRSRLETYA